MDNVHGNHVLNHVRAALGRRETLKPVQLAPFDEPGLFLGDATERFIKEATALGSVIYRVRTVSELLSAISKICTSDDEIVMTHSAVFEELELATHLSHSSLKFTPISERSSEHVTNRLAATAVGLTGIDCAIAETGTILLTSEDEHSLLVSLLPPIHIAVLRPSQIKVSLGEVIERLGGEMSADSSIRSGTFISGPSRTSDVELTLSIGVHGPKELHLIIVD